jgi:molybdopterin-synthase adenylyltransferase
MGGAPRFRLRSCLEAFFASDGNVYLLRGGADEEYVIRQPALSDRALLRRLSREGVRVAPGSREEERLAPLIRMGVVVHEPQATLLGPVDAQRFARQLSYLEDFGDPIAGQQRLRRASVAVLGCGGLGTWALAALASAGIGRFVLIDDDEVALSNLNRQILYRADDVGKPKAERVAAWLAAFDPAIKATIYRERIADAAQLSSRVAGCDVLLLTADWPPYELTRWANQACLAHGVPFITVGQQPPLLKIGPTYVPGRGACFACHEQRLRRDFPLYEELAAHRRRHPPHATTLGPASGAIGALVSLEVLHLLLGHWPLATHERVLVIDMRTLQLTVERIERDPSCVACAPGGVRTR